MARLLIVDDEPSICWGLARAAEEMGHEAVTAASVEQALGDAAAPPDVIVLDVHLPGVDGLTAMPQFRARFGAVPIIIITAYGQLSTAVEAVRNGASEYLTKPFDLATAQRAIQRALESRNVPRAEATAPGDEEIVGASPPMQEFFKRIALVAATEACVHLRGESGSGKELAARAIHRYSRRAAGPFIAVNMAALAPTLAESELFGHTRGAFTGAEHARAGLLEQAHGGTIFLDEVADIPLPLQVKLLRALEQGEFAPVGAERPVRSDFRLISATHQNLARLVAENRFRHDLYFRLVAFEIELPPLRNRPDDVPALVDHFLRQLTARQGGSPPAVAAAAMRELQQRYWHGNVRELRNALEHALILARDGVILPEHLPPALPPPFAAEVTGPEAIAALLWQWAEARLKQSASMGTLYEECLRLIEPALFEAAIKQYGGQCLAAAKHLGLHRTTLRKKLDQYGIGGER